jgi:glycosyltransferase involved in cell wall biosynthesis
VGQNIGRALIKLGNEVDFVSTDGFQEKYCPTDLKPFVREKPFGTYDCQVSYTAPHNWPDYLSHGKKNRFAIWNYEYNSKGNAPKSLLQGFAKYHHAVDMVLPSSYFTKEVFESMKIPTDRMVVVPHGINLDDFKSNKKVELRTNKSKKILLNIAQPHRRKALPLALKAFGKAFTKDDDVCLVAKVFTKNKGIQGRHNQFDVDFPAMYKTFENKFKNHAEVEFVSSYIPNIAEIYNACDINYSTTYAECFWLPGLEAMASGLINVAPNYGGLLDFCNAGNSLLVGGDIKRAGRQHQYWKFNPYAVHFEVNIDDAAEKLRTAVNDYDNLLVRFRSPMEKIVNKFTWARAAQQIIGLCA